MTVLVQPGEAPVVVEEPRTDRAAALEAPPAGDRMRGWLVTIVVTLIGAVVRFWNLGYPTDKGTPIFDEKHYVPHSAQVLRNGGYEDNPGYELIVHPPLAKQLMAMGQDLFGYDGLGWRFASAVAGTLTILMIIRIARRLTRSDLLGALAGVLLIADGVSHVGSRMGMLDVFLAAFVVAAFGCLVVDREQVRERLAVAVREGFINNSAFGPWLGFRWWRAGAGVFLGLACSVKWSGLWYIVAFGLLTVVWSALARRAAGVEEPWLGALAKDVLPSLGGLLAIPVAAYLVTWFPWMASETGIDRHVVGNKIADLWYVPDILQSLWYNAKTVYKFHVELVTSETNRHPWESKPWTWPMGLRPMLYYYDNTVTGCGAASCLGAIMLIGTPAMWWLAFPVIGWAVWRSIGRMDWRYAGVLVAYAAGLLPWFLNLDRQMYFFYVTPMAPFLVLMIVLALGEILGRSSAGSERRGTGLLVVALYVGIVVANFVWLWPILNGVPITPEMWQQQLWLPSWR